MKGPDINRDELRRNLYKHVKVLSEDIGERSGTKYDNIIRAKKYIEKELSGLPLRYSEQSYELGGKPYSNLIAEKKGTGEPDKVLIIGAHYDTVPGTPGADDNAGAVAALIELARLFSETETPGTFRFIAFVLEEPPFFGTSSMGSMVYAESLRSSDAEIVGMIALEMLGCYSNEKNSQSYPLPFMDRVYPDRGDFIGIVGNHKSRGLTKDLSELLKKHCSVGVESMAAPPLMPAVDLSDHFSFWKHGYPAVMVTDTAFYRNPNYHGPGDTIDTLDFSKFSEVTAGLFGAIYDLHAQKQEEEQ